MVKELDTVSRIDIVWDVYQSDSLKHATREEKLEHSASGFILHKTSRQLARLSSKQ